MDENLKLKILEKFQQKLVYDLVQQVLDEHRVYVTISCKVEGPEVLSICLRVLLYGLHAVVLVTFVLTQLQIQMRGFRDHH